MQTPPNTPDLYQWMRLVLVEFLVPVAWPLVTLTIAYFLRVQLAAGVTSITKGLADFISSRISRFRYGKLDIEALPPAEVKERILIGDQTEDDA